MVRAGDLVKRLTELAPVEAGSRLLLIVLVSMAAGGRACAETGGVTLRHLYTVEAGQVNPRLITPVALFFDPKRKELHVADAGTSVVTTFAGGPRPVGRFYHRQKGKDENGEPAGLAVDGRGNIVVSDALIDRVFTYDYRGEPSGYIQMPAGSGGLLMPGKMAVDGAGNLYVAVRNAGVVLVFGPDGALERRVDGSAFGVTECSDVAVDEAGNIWMLSPKGAVVHEFDKQGKHLRQFGSHSAGKAAFSRPAAIDVDGSGRVWICDMVTHTLKLYRANGTFLAELGGLGDQNGAFFSPTDLFIDRGTQTLYVLEKSGLRIQAFAIQNGSAGRSDAKQGR